MSAWDNDWILPKYHISLFLKIIELIWSQRVRWPQIISTEAKQWSVIVSIHFLHWEGCTTASPTSPFSDHRLYATFCDALWDTIIEAITILIYYNEYNHAISISSQLKVAVANKLNIQHLGWHKATLAFSWGCVYRHMTSKFNI